MDFFFPMHVGCGNRGCEGIIRGTINILKPEKSNVYLLEMNEKELINDNKLNISDIANLHVRDKNSLVIKIMHKLRLCEKKYYINPYKAFFNLTDNQSVVFFSGGDLYCYDDTVKQNYYIQKYLNKKNIDTVLWGASIEKKQLTRNVVEQMKNFKFIICRESLSIENLESANIKENVFLVPDPAFSLEPIVTKLPSCFNDRKVIGINISNMVNGGGTDLNTKFGRNIINLIEYILATTNDNILLIPHVIWSRQDDQIIIQELMNKISCSERVSTLSIHNLGYLEIRYIIGHCRLFIGARTHSVVSAYAMHIPTLALGYSIKARGIAKDLNINSNLVFDTRNILNDYELCDHFSYLVQNELQISRGLEKEMVDYVKTSYDSYEILKQYYKY